MKLAVETDDLLPFDINAYRADPSRLRHIFSNKNVHPMESQEALGALVVKWTDDSEPSLYQDLSGGPNCLLRLAPPKPNRLFVRILRYPHGALSAHTGNSAECFDYATAGLWASDAIEIQLYPEPK